MSITLLRVSAKGTKRELVGDFFAVLSECGRQWDWLLSVVVAWQLTDAPLARCRAAFLFVSRCHRRLRALFCSRVLCLQL